MLPLFTDDSVLPPRDYVLALQQVPNSLLVAAPGDLDRYAQWDVDWRRQLEQGLQQLARLQPQQQRHEGEEQHRVPRGKLLTGMPQPWEPESARFPGGDTKTAPRTATGSGTTRPSCVSANRWAGEECVAGPWRVAASERRGPCKRADSP